MSHVLSLVGDEATRAEGVTLLPVGAKWSALALECVGVCSSGLRLTADEELSMEEVTTFLHCIVCAVSFPPTHTTPGWPHVPYSCHACPS